MNNNTDFTLPSDLTGFHIHFVGIKGTGCAALVEIYHSRGAYITGSDVPEQFYTEKILERLNIKVFTTFSKENITDDIKLVVYSSAYKLDQNPDLIEATKKNIPILLYSEALGAISKTAFSCGIAGVHGKTTTTGLTGTILKGLKLPVQVLAGSVISSFNTEENNDSSIDNGTCTLSIGHDYFVAETCEYQRHFMAFHPQKIILTSVESDHQDYYPTYNDIRQAFIDYLCLLPENGEVIYCVDDVGATETAHFAKLKRDDLILTPYGQAAVGDYKITFGKIGDGKQHFSLQGIDNEFYLRIPGRHNIKNASAAIALSISLLKDFKKKHDLPLEITKDEIAAITESLGSFCGSKRRSEVVGVIPQKDEQAEIVIIDDYGHHPTAVRTTLQGYKTFYPNHVLIADFMSHTYSRTLALLDQFSECFWSCDELILHKIFSSARENPKDFEDKVSGKILYEKTLQHHKKVTYFEEILDALPFVIDRLKQPLPKGKKGYVFVTMGAGDNYKLGKEVYKTFSK